MSDFTLANTFLLAFGLFTYSAQGTRVFYLKYRLHSLNY
jgi:hypothetical protein